MPILVIGDATPTFPEEFQARLQRFDKDLLLTWHHPPTWPKSRRGVWKVEQCIQHHGGFNFDGSPKHDHTCNRIYVLMCQDEDGTPKPLGEWILDELKKRRQNSERLGGETERGLRNFKAESNAIDEAREQKREHDGREATRLNSLDNRLAWNRAMHLIQQHDMRPNK